MNLTLPTDSEARKDVPVMSGCMNYFPAALAWIARISVKGDRKHNPENAGNPPFHARGKSMDHGDCIIRHTMDIEDLKAAYTREPLVSSGQQIVEQLLEEAAYRAWRACAELQELCETYEGAPLAPAARLPASAELQELCETYEGAPLAPAARLPAIQEKCLDGENCGRGGLLCSSCRSPRLAERKFTDAVLGQYNLLATSGVPVGGLVAGCARSNGAFVNRALEVGDDDERYGNGY